jgi:hypothetical protein
MTDRKKFIEKMAPLDLTRAGQAIALLWFYRHNQTFEERTAEELADDLRDEGLGRPNVTNLRSDLKKNPKTVNGKRSGTFQINVKYLDELNKTYGPLVDYKNIEVTSSILPVELVTGTRRYIEQMVSQINGSYDSGFYDACAVMARRLMESLIIEVYIYKDRADEIKIDGKIFFDLDSLINKISHDKKINLGRNNPESMVKIKEIGDTAAHDRVYITRQPDIDDAKQRIRKVVNELLILAGIIK